MPEKASGFTPHGTIRVSCGSKPRRVCSPWSHLLTKQTVPSRSIGGRAARCGSLRSVRASPVATKRRDGRGAPGDDQ